jgi:ribonuclease-3
MGELNNLLENYNVKLKEVQLNANAFQQVFQFHEKENERLEFLGDGILEAFVKDYIYRRFPKENEGFLNDIKIAMVCNENIGKIAYTIGLHKWIILTKKQEEEKIRTNFAQLGDVMESFLGALYLQIGFDKTYQFLQSLFEDPELIDWQNLITNDIHQNYKNKLQIFIQRERNGMTPYYAEIAPKNAEGVGTLGVFLGAPSSLESFPRKVSWKGDEWKSLPKGSLLGIGQHKIRKKAENLACKHAMETIMK